MNGFVCSRAETVPRPFTNPCCKFRDARRTPCRPISAADFSTRSVDQTPYRSPPSAATSPWCEQLQRDCQCSRPQPLAPPGYATGAIVSQQGRAEQSGQWGSRCRVQRPATHSGASSAEHYPLLQGVLISVSRFSGPARASLDSVEHSLHCHFVSSLPYSNMGLRSMAHISFRSFIAATCADYYSQ